MRAIILDYSDGTIVLLNIPKERENEADDYVRERINADECAWMVVVDDTTDVYRLERNDEGENEYEYETEI